MSNINTIYQNINNIKADEKTKKAISGIINDKVDDGFDRIINQLNARFNILDNKVETVRTELNTKIDVLDNKIESVRTELNTKIDVLDNKVETVRTELNTKVESVKTELNSKINILDNKVNATNRLSTISITLIIAIFGAIVAFFISEIAKK